MSTRYGLCGTRGPYENYFATDEEFEQAKKENPRHFLVIDLGRTEVAPNTPTCFGLWPMRKSRRSPILTRLKRL